MFTSKKITLLTVFIPYFFKSRVGILWSQIERTQTSFFIAESYGTLCAYLGNDIGSEIITKQNVSTTIRNHGQQGLASFGRLNKSHAKG